MLKQIFSPEPKSLSTTPSQTLIRSDEKNTFNGSLSSSSSPQTAATQPTNDEQYASTPSPDSFSRARKQIGLVFAGAAFVTLSTLITRRAIHRRFLAAVPPFYDASTRQAPKVTSGAFEAVEALSLASVNVFSWSIFLVGGGLWAYDISGFQEFRRRLRRGMGFGVDGGEVSEKDVEEEIEEWIAGVLARKEEKEKRREDGQVGGEEERSGRRSG